MPQQTSPRTGTQDLAVQTRAAQFVPTSFNQAANTIDVVFAAGAMVTRQDPWDGGTYQEELVVSADAVDLSHIDAGTAQVLDNHQAWGDLRSVLGVVTRGWVAGSQAFATLLLSSDPAKAGIVGDIQRGVIRAISVGYVVQRYEIVPPEQRSDGVGVPLWRAVRWTPREISFVSMPADPAASTRSATPTSVCAPCEFITRGASVASTTPQEGTMPQTTQETAAPSSTAAAAPAAQGHATPTPAGTAPAGTTETRGAAPTQPHGQVGNEPSNAFVQRAADISTLCTRHGVPAMAADLIRSGVQLDGAREAVLNAIAVRDAASGGHHVARVETVSDETETRMRGLESALLSRLMPSHTLDDNARQYRHLTLLEMGREHLERSGMSTRGMDRMGIASRMLQVRAAGMHTTSDFGYLFGNVASRRLRAVYDSYPSTYTQWARRGPNLTDFKPVTIVSMGSGPELLKVNEHGEYKYGTFGDGAEAYQLATYGRIVAMTRQAIINDDLRGFDRLISLFGTSASRLENRLVYDQLAGAMKMGDGKTLFHADHGNLVTGAGSALSLDALQAARAKMRAQKGSEGERLNISPKYLIVPSTLETLAYQLTSNAYAPARMQDVNDFRSGGRTPLEVIVEPVLDDVSATAWYLAADSAVIDTVEYAYLEGADGPVTETREGFEVDGTEVKCRLDFAGKALDWHGLVKSTGTA